MVGYQVGECVCNTFLVHVRHFDEQISRKMKKFLAVAARSCMQGFYHYQIFEVSHFSWTQHHEYIFTSAKARIYVLLALDDINEVAETAKDTLDPPGTTE